MFTKAALLPYAVFTKAAVLHVRLYAVFTKAAMLFQTIVVLFVLV